VRFVRFEEPPALAGFGIVTARGSGLVLGLSGTMPGDDDGTMAAIPASDDGESRRRDRYGTLALLAAREALERAGRLEGGAVAGQAGAPGAVGSRWGVMIGTTHASAERNGRYACDLAKGDAALSPALFVRTTSGAAAADIAFAFRMGGPGQTFVSGWTAGAEALAGAARAVSRGAADLVLAGGVEVPGPIFGRTGPALTEAAAMVVVVAGASGNRRRLLAYGRGRAPEPGGLERAIEAGRGFECDTLIIANDLASDPWLRPGGVVPPSGTAMALRRLRVGEQVGALGAAGLIAGCAMAAEIPGRSLVVARDPSGDVAAVVLG
jgi:hypothetical protein